LPLPARECRGYHGKVSAGPDLSALAAIVDARLRADYAPWYPGVGQQPARVEIYASVEANGQFHVQFIADSYVYNHAQSGSDWADHYIYAGEAVCNGPQVRAHRLVLFEHVPMSEYDSNTYDQDKTFSAARARLVARREASSSAEVIRCPACGSTRAGITELSLERIRFTCDACGRTELRVGLTEWTARLPPDTSLVPELLPT
jgi:hypothetical protein